MATTAVIVAVTRMENTSEMWPHTSEITTSDDMARNVSVSHTPNTINVTDVTSVFSTKSQTTFGFTLDPVEESVNGSSLEDGNFSSRMGNFTSPGRDLSLEFLIPMYSIIFLLSVVGNILVIVTVIQNKKMRSVTNVFLLNLSLSDLLLTVFCMPFTLVPLFLKNFIFGEVMCVLIRYMQGVSVAVSCFTLVAISLERYFAICHPLKSRRWQTLSHSYKAITVCWVAAFLLMIPSAVYHDLVEIRPHIHACREIWPSSEGLKAFTVALNLLLLVFPCIIMSWAYGCVSYTLWIGIKLEKQSEKETQSKLTTAEYDTQNGVSLGLKKKLVLTRGNEDTDFPTVNSVSGQTTGASSKVANVVTRPVRRMDAQRAMRQSNTERSRAAKKRVIKMLFMIVLEFFIFWSPTFILDTWMAFHYASARRNIIPMTKSLIHLVSYISACCNPITYCFMNKNFRQSFLLAFRCMKTRYVYANRSQMSFTSGNTMSTRAPATPSMATSYDKIVDSDDISENSV